MILLLVHDSDNLYLAIIGQVEDRMPPRCDFAQTGTWQFGIRTKHRIFYDPLDLPLYLAKIAACLA